MKVGEHESGVAGNSGIQGARFKTHRRAILVGVLKITAQIWLLATKSTG